jgi:hypothetical protein
MERLGCGTRSREVFRCSWLSLCASGSAGVETLSPRFEIDDRLERILLRLSKRGCSLAGYGGSAPRRCSPFRERQNRIPVHRTNSRPKPEIKSRQHVPLPS